MWLDSPHLGVPIPPCWWYLICSCRKEGRVDLKVKNAMYFILTFISNKKERRTSDAIMILLDYHFHRYNDWHLAPGFGTGVGIYLLSVLAEEGEDFEEDENFPPFLDESTQVLSFRPSVHSSVYPSVCPSVRPSVPIDIRLSNNRKKSSFVCPLVGTSRVLNENSRVSPGNKLQTTCKDPATPSSKEP